MKPANIAQHSMIQKVSRFLHLDIPEVWVRFLLAIVGLVLAFGAALFSTVSRESGNLWATVLLASTALVLAVVVGLTTVPYLARRVAGAGIRDAFDFDVTKVGIVYVAIVTADRDCRPQHRQQSALHRGGGDAGRDPGFWDCIGYGTAQFGT